MAQAPEQEPVMMMPQDEDEALLVLQNELGSQASTLSAESQTRQVEAMTAANAIDGPRRTKDVAMRSGNVELNTALSALNVTPTITNESLRRDKESGTIMRVPKGTGFSAQGNVKVDKDPVTGEIIIKNDRPTAPLQTGPTQSDSKVMEAHINDNKRTNREFNVNEALEKARTLSGEALLGHVSQTLANIDVQMANEATRIRQAAALESGYTAALAALDRNVMLDDSTGFAARYSQASHQTLQARAEVTRALSVAHTLEGSLLRADSRIAELNGVKNSLAKFEAKRVGREMKDEDKREQAAELVSPQQLANYRILKGSSGDDIKDKLSAIAQAKNDKTLMKLLTIDKDNIHINLLDADAKVRDGALKLFTEYEKAANPQYKDQPTTPTTELIKKALNNPDELFKFAPDEETRNTIKRKFATTKSGKELAELRQQYLPNLLAAYVENTIQGQFKDNMRTWKGVGVNDDSPLAAAVKKVAATHPQGKAPINSVIDVFMQDNVTLANGAKLDLPTKVKLLTSAVESSVQNMDKNLLIDATAIEAIGLRMKNQIKIDAARAHIRGMGGDFMDVWWLGQRTIDQLDKK